MTGNRRGEISENLFLSPVCRISKNLDPDYLGGAVRGSPAGEQCSLSEQPLAASRPAVREYRRSCRCLSIIIFSRHGRRPPPRQLQPPVVAQPAPPRPSSVSRHRDVARLERRQRRGGGLDTKPLSLGCCRGTLPQPTWTCHRDLVTYTGTFLQGDLVAGSLSQGPRPGHRGLVAAAGVTRCAV